MFDLVKQMKKEGKAEISDVKITAQEWSKTIDKIVELQQKGAELGQQKIYQGGNDRNDFRGSFIVHPDQEIEFSAEEMNALYDAMGVTIKSRAEGVSDETELPEPATDISTKDATTSTKDANPPTDANFVESGNNPVKKSSPLTGQELVINPLNGGKRVKDFLTGNEYKYYTDGYVMNTYDKDGRITREIVCKLDGTVRYYMDCEYDAKGNHTRSIIFNSVGTVGTYYDHEYDENGNQTGMIVRNPDGTERQED